MKVALYTSNRTTIPPEPDIVSATATLTALLANGLVEQGHDVTLYAAKGSRSKAKIVDLGLPPPRLDYSLQGEEWVKNMNLGMKQIYLSELYKDADKYDIIHLQTEPVYLGMPYAKLVKTPTVITNHNIFIPHEKPLFDYYAHQPIVSISDYQRTPFPHLSYIATVYDGLTISKYPFYEEIDPDQHLAFMGRLVAVKGVKEAIGIAQKIKRKLILAGKGTQSFIDETITPHLSPIIEFKGHIPHETPAWFDHYGKAKAYLAPIQWDEPFGMVLIEAMATGTPVVAFAKGAIPEIIKDGVTGFIINPSDDDIRGDFIIKKTGIEGMCEAVERIYALNETDYKQMRFNSRKQVENNFTTDKMITGYIDVYQKIIDNKSK